MEDFMKNAGIFGFVFIAITFISCMSDPVPYSFAWDEKETAEITFVDGNPGIRLINYDGQILPPLERNTRWGPITFPAGRPLSIIFYAYYQQSQDTTNRSLLGVLVQGAIHHSRSVSTNVVFECPPLEAGGDYTLRFRKYAGIPGANALELTDNRTRRVVYEQIFE